MSKQDIEGTAPPDGAAGTPARPAGTPESLAQQLEKERDARALMRERLRNTEALAAESHALRERMAQELERVTADRDRLRTAAAGAPQSGVDIPLGDAPARATLPPADPFMAPHSADWLLRPPAPPRRRGPWRALAMLGGLAAGVAALAWFTGSLPSNFLDDVAAASAPAATPPSAAAPRLAAASRPATRLALAAASAPAPNARATTLPALTPEQQLAAAPTAAGPPAVATPAVAATSPGAAPTGLGGRLRSALDGEGIASPVEVEAATGRVLVADPQADRALRDRTDVVIRAVYAGASLPEPQIEHRWMSPMRAARAAPAALAPTPAPASLPVRAGGDGAATAGRRLVSDRHRKDADDTVADAEELRPVVPAGRVTAGCMASLPSKSASRRSALTACMKQSCCSTGNRGTEECRAYVKAYPFTCSAG